jgi:hypothetical protein
LQEWGITPRDQSLSSEEKRSKLERQTVEIESLIRSENTAKIGVEKLVQFYVSDPNAQRKVRFLFYGYEVY